ncbi:hypothetical protein [Aliiroseovarius lamellibrachiae]|uniref:hypothetical protein n=1 Tax=Aliiroseovarius lamellibrachiae TaxID=1924933 RepID=UPI001BDF8142|nr:hypothetical protein [Aliiroseovarius lamellibrachiae]MBT2129906.1 hypothetical protein [Aliiroseovarius lamellibrachiae]
MKTLVLTALVSALLAGCAAHVPEAQTPGVSLSGTASAGVKYQDGATTTANETKLKIGVSGAL